MQADGAIDENCLGDFLDELIEQGANGVVIAGTTGESPTLSMHEHRQLIAFAIKSVADVFRLLPVSALMQRPNRLN